MKTHIQAPTLETDRLILRAHTRTDFEPCFKMWSDPRVTEYIGGKPSTEQETWFRLMRYLGHWPLLGFGFWAAEEKQSGQFIGEMGFADFKREMTPSIQGVPELGWALRSEFHGKGYATEALKKIITWSQQQYSWKKTVCIINPENKISIRVADKCGYTLMCQAEMGGKPILLFERKME